MDLDAMLPAIEYVFSLDKVTDRFTVEEMHQLRKAAEFSSYSYTAQENLKNSQWRIASKGYWKALKLYPGRLREWILLCCAMSHCLPQFIRGRLK